MRIRHPLSAHTYALATYNKPWWLPVLEPDRKDGTIDLGYQLNGGVICYAVGALTFCRRADKRDISLGTGGLHRF